MEVLFLKNCRFLTVLFTLVLFSFIFSMAVFSEENVNLIKNGDFELEDNSWNSTNQGIIVTGESYGDGNRAGSVPNTALSGNFGSGYIGQIVNVEPNTTYRVTAMGKVDVEGATGIFTGRWWNNGAQGSVITKEGMDASGTIVDQAITSLDWEEVSYEFNSGNHTQVLIQLVKWSDQEVTKKANLYIDNVAMVKIDESTDEEENPEYNVVWEDNFDQDELNMDDWGYELGSIRGWEQQHYVNNPENVYLKDGNLVLQATDRAVEDHYNNPRNPDRRVIYNSGSIRTHGKREFLYGKIEMRAKLPKGQGVFPAFWTLGADFVLDGKINGLQGRGWPRTGEIDITELVGVAEDGNWYNRTVWQTMHYGAGTENNGKYAGNGTGYSIPAGNFNDDYHVFGIEWSEGIIKWYVDDKIVRVVDYSDDPLAMLVFNKPHYIQLNLAMGGAWPGPVGEDLAGTKYEIDYVRYMKTAQQEEDAMKYYATAPTLDGAEDVTITQGESVDLVAGLQTEENNEIDFSIEDEYMFSPTGGNTNVQLLIKGKHEMEKISELPVGQYNIHYSAYPKGVNLDQDLSAKVTRKTVKLTVEPRPQTEIHPDRKGNKYTVDAKDLGELEKYVDVVVEIAEQKNAKVVLTTEAIKMLKEANATVLISNGVVDLKVLAADLPDRETEFKVKEKNVKEKSVLVGYDFTIKPKGNHKFTGKVGLTFTIDSILVNNPENVKALEYKETTEKWEVIGGEYKDGKITVEAEEIRRIGVFEME